MKKIKTLILGIITATSLISCASSDNGSLSSDVSNISSNVNSSMNSAYRAVNGTFSAQIDRNIEDVYNATYDAIQNNNQYQILTHNSNLTDAHIHGVVTKTGSEFDIDISKVNPNLSNIYIKFGTIGDKEKSIDLLSSVRQSLGL